MKPAFYDLTLHVSFSFQRFHHGRQWRTDHQMRALWTLKLGPQNLKLPTNQIKGKFIRSFLNRSNGQLETLFLLASYLTTIDCLKF